MRHPETCGHSVKIVSDEYICNMYLMRCEDAEVCQREQQDAFMLDIKELIEQVEGGNEE